MNISVVYMQATVFTLFGSFVAFCWLSLRRERRRGPEAPGFDPGAGRVRWTTPPESGGAPKAGDTASEGSTPS